MDVLVGNELPCGAAVVALRQDCQGAEEHVGIGRADEAVRSLPTTGVTALLLVARPSQTPRLNRRGRPESDCRESREHCRALAFQGDFWTRRLADDPGEFLAHLRAIFGHSASVQSAHGP